MMEKFEKDLKKHFQQRELPPSADAWQHMEQLLEKETKQKPQELFYWTTIAASMLLLVGGWWFFQSTNPSMSEINPAESFVVDTKNEVAPLVKKDSLSTKSKKNNEQMVAHQTPKKKTVVDKVPAEIIEKNENPSNEYEIGEWVKNEHIVQKSDKEIEEKFLAHQSKVEIKVNRERLLRSAEIERQIENVTTDGQNFWKKVGEKHNLVQH